jgi:hypothetical protein
VPVPAGVKQKQMKIMNLLKDNSFLTGVSGVIAKLIVVLQWVGRLLAILPPCRKTRKRRRNKNKSQIIK